jgi:hypothetical protein
MTYRSTYRDRYGRQYDEDDDRYENRYYRGSSSYDDDDYGSIQNRRYERDDDYERHGRARDYDRDDRGFFERAGDEVRSWFGDDEAERRRRHDMNENYRERRNYFGNRYRDRTRYDMDDDSREDRYRYSRDRDRERGYYGRERDYDRDERGFLDRAGDAMRSWLGDDEPEERRYRTEPRGRSYRNNYDRDDYDRHRREDYNRYGARGRYDDYDYGRGGNFDPDRGYRDPYGEIGFGSRFGRADQYGEYNEHRFSDPYTKRVW